jgi:hydrogenase-4 component B
MGFWGIGALGALLLRHRFAAAVVGAAGAVGGGLAAAVCGAAAVAGAPRLWAAAWPVPGGAFALRLDPLAAVFLLPIAVIGAVAAVYGVAYQRDHASGRSRGASFAAYNVLLLSMAIVATADNLVLLLVAWELMTLSSWALVVEDHHDVGVRVAGIQYLVAGHLATAALLLMALLLATSNQSFAIAPLGSHAVAPAGTLFALALIGFGTKGGIVPLHVWLPDAHASAPSYVSALMSGVMITMGFYGLARFVPLFGVPALWWAYLLVILGAAGAVAGMLFALPQRDVKRALAYSTVENAGLATLAMGVGILGTALHDPLLAALGWTAALLHLWNHALVKSVLFLGFGAVAMRARSRDLDAMGGFLRRWKTVGGVLVVGAAAIAALPGLNVFASEWLLLRALLAGILNLTGIARVALVAALGALVFAGGLALAGFARLVGVGLLGVPRTKGAAEAREPGWMMRGPLLVLGVACVAVAAAPGRVAALLSAAVRGVASNADVTAAGPALHPVAMLLPLLAGVAGLVIAVRAAWARHVVRRIGETWGCGYPAPQSSMQYSSTSFADGLTTVMQPVLRVETRRRVVPGGVGAAALLWPVAAEWASSTADRMLAGVYRPVFARVDRGAAWLRSLHRARVTTSLVYMVATMVVLLALLFLPGLGR